MNYEQKGTMDSDTGTLTVIPPRPGLLSSAVAAVMKDVKRLEKADNNAFAKYKFTSVDDYKDNLRPLIAQKGLETCLSQVGFERFEHAAKGKDTGVHCQYDFILWLKHESGEVGAPEGSTICLPYTGAQTTGQARSYAQKEWLKSKFLASSGDTAEDADAYALDIKLSKGEARKIYDRLVAELREFGKYGVEGDIEKWGGINSVFLEAMPNDWMIELRNEGKQAGLLIKDREIAGHQIEVPTDIENWLSDLNACLAAQYVMADLENAWAEAQPMASALPPEESRRAFEMIAKHRQRLA